MTASTNTNFQKNPGLSFLDTVLYQMPEAYARLTGAPDQEDITGIVRFYSTRSGVLVNAEVYGLPSSSEPCTPYIHGFHIHEGGSCTGNNTDPFANAGLHYNPSACPHPEHTGDLPPLFSNNGFAWMLYFTDRFSIPEILGKTVIVHEKPDDFKTQPAGDSGSKLACGVITAS